MKRLFLSLALFCGGLAALADEPAARIDVTSDPAGATVLLDGTPRGTAPCSLYGIVPGAHHLRIVQGAYMPADEMVTVAAGDHLAKTFTLVPEKALVLLQSEPSGAEVRCEGATLGATPLLVTSLNAGRSYALELSLNGYQRRKITVAPADRRPVTRLERLTLDSGTIYCTSEPAGARVTVNGVMRGVTPVEVTHVPKGVATVSIAQDGYQPVTRSLTLVAGERQTLAVKLTGVPARLTVVTSPEQARVFVDNEYQGRSPVQGISLAAGSHAVRVELPGHAPLTRTVEVSNGQTLTEEFTMQNVLGRLEIVTVPPGAKVVLDGKAVGTTRSAGGDEARSRVLGVEKVVAGEHSVLVRLDGYQDETRKIVVKSNETRTLHVKLKSLFIPDTEVETINGTAPIRGVLVSNDPLGITLRLRPGVERTIPRAEVRQVKSLK